MTSNETILNNLVTITKNYIELNKKNTANQKIEQESLAYLVTKSQSILEKFDSEKNNPREDDKKLNWNLFKEEVSHFKSDLKLYINIFETYGFNDPSKFKSTIIDADINKKNNAEFLKSNDFVKEETSFEENDKLEDMVHSLQSFGISEFSLKILGKGNNLNDEEGIQDNKFNEILEFKDYKLFQDCTNLNGISPMSSNAMEPPTLTSLETPPIPKRKSDSIFDPLMSAVSENEYFKLPEFITNQISLIQLNEVVQEFNDAITDKRFLNDASINELSVQDLKKLSVEKRFIKPSLTALLFLEKLDHRDEVASHDSQNLTKLYRVKF